MTDPEGFEKQESYSTKLRAENPEKMTEVEAMVRNFWSKAKLETDPQLSDKSVALVANSVVNRLRRTIEAGEDDEAQLNKAVEDALYEGIDVRLKTRDLENRPDIN